MPQSHLNAAPFATDDSLQERILIQVTDFYKAYRGTVAVEALSFDAQPGQILGLLGPNGAGKTTTMRAIAGVIPPTRGRLLVSGHDVSIDPVTAKGLLAYVPDDPKLFDALTVWEHLQFIAAAYGVKNFEAEALALLDQFELTSKRDALAQELSRGMRQKVAICCAYLHHPRAILFDEPITGLDPHGIRTMKQSMRQRAAAGAAVIISSHLLSLVEDLCTDLLILDHGRRIFFGPVEDAKLAFANVSGDPSLEEMFFRATDREVPGRIPAAVMSSLTP
jgi:ABC-2 type transport system ATP-binding protein